MGRLNSKSSADILFLILTSDDGFRDYEKQSF